MQRQSRPTIESRRWSERAERAVLVALAAIRERRQVDRLLAHGAARYLTKP